MKKKSYGKFPMVKVEFLLFLVVVIGALGYMLFTYPLNFRTSIASLVQAQSSLSLLATLDLPTQIGTTDISVVGGHAYVTRPSSSSYEFAVIDTSVLNSPAVVGSLDFSAKINSVSVTDNIAYLATSHNSSELVGVDVSNESQPNIIRTFDTPGLQDALSVFALPGRVYVGTANNSGTNSEFYIFDTTGPSIQLLGSFDAGGSVNGIYVKDNDAYLATSNGTREIVKLDMTNPANPAVVASFNAPSAAAANNLTVLLGKVYAVFNNSSANNDFYVLDAGTLNMVSGLNLGSANTDLVVTGGRAYVSTKTTSASIKVVNVLNPANPTYEALLGLSSSVEGISFANGFFFLASNHNTQEFMIVDAGISNPPSVVFNDINGDGIWRIACLGDSNTQTVPPIITKKWCEHLSDTINDSRVQVVNISHAGATVTHQQNNPDWQDAYLHVDLALQQNIDALVLAYGTNDHFQGRSPQEVIDAYLTHEQTALAAGVNQYFVATTPDIQGKLVPRILLYNDLIRNTFSGRFLEFHSGFILEEHFNADGYHFNAAGQILRGQRAFEAIAIQ
ncbi:MAG: GDSL-type esterase/lipase family protein [Patescibacteria group bacterium]